MVNLFFSNIGLVVLFFLCALILMLNLYGQLRSMRYRHFTTAPEALFRFGREIPIHYDEAIKNINELKVISDPLEYAQLATQLTSKCIAHLEWTKLDPIENFQTVPLWENPILYLLGRFSGLAHFQRYNFTYYRRTLERGFGICGDASMILSQLLDKKAIFHEIIAFDEHVLIEATIEGKKYALDPDFGVSSDFSVKQLAKNEHLAANQYLYAGYPESDALLMARIFNGKYLSYRNVYSFVKKRYLIERLSYWCFWYCPPFGIITVLVIFQAT